MNKIILIALIVTSVTSFAKSNGNVMYDTISTNSYQPYKSHWEATFGFEGMKYPVPFEFSGNKKSFSPNDKELWGGRLGIGRQVYLGKGFSATTKAEGYYMGTLFAQTVTAGPQESEEEYKKTKQTGQIFGADITQNIGYIFDMKTKGPLGDMHNMTIEPYIEAGVGAAMAYNKLKYSYTVGTQESYTASANDQLMNFRYGLGVNITASSGLFFFLKATQNHYDMTQRKLKSNENGVSTKDTQKNVNIDPILIYALGGGYRF